MGLQGTEQLGTKQKLFRPNTVKALISFGLIAGIGLATLPLTSYAGTDSDSAEVHASVLGTISITAINNQALGLTIGGGDVSSGTPVTGYHTVQVLSTIPGGYTLSMQADDANLRQESTPSVYDGAIGFAPIGGSITNEANPNLSYNLATLNGVAFPGTAPATGSWGFNLNGGTNYTSVPAFPLVIAATNNSAESFSNPTTITFGAQAGLTTPAGTYGATITYVATTNQEWPPLMPADMQTITAANCPVERTMVRDARDGSTYWIRKIPGTGAGGTDLCWMETNLAYAGGGANTYGDTAVLQAGTIAPGILNPANTSSGQACFSDNPSMNANGLGCYWNPVGSNVTNGTTDPSTSTNGTGQYGLLYNWCAAMGNQPAACQTGAATQPNQSVNDGTNVYNVCPANWRLPTGEPTTGEFTLLNNVINGGSTTSPSGLFTSSLFMYSGYFIGGGFGLQGTTGYYWSSTVYDATGAERLVFNSTSVNPAIYGFKSGGFAVRCVAP